MLTVSPIYAGLLALLMIWLSVRVSVVRRRLKISTGDGGEKAMFKAIRVHSNSAEHIPLAIILLILLDLQSAPGWALHLAGLSALIGRAAHAYGLGRQPQFVPGRVYGAYLTLFMIIGAAIANIAYAVF